MTGVWTNSGEGWEWGKPRAFEDEAKLHELIGENPPFLPPAILDRQKPPG